MFTRVSPDNIGALLDSPPLVSGGATTVALLATAKALGTGRVAPSGVASFASRGTVGVKATATFAGKISLAARGAGAAAGRAVASTAQLLALIARGLATLSSSATTHGVAALSARGAAGVKATATFAGKISLAARGAGAAAGRAVANTAQLFALIARGLVTLSGGTTMHGAAALRAAGASASNRTTSSLAGRISLVARAASAATGRGILTTAQILLLQTRSAARSFGRIAGSMSLSFLASGNSRASGRAGISGKIGVAASGLSAVFGRLFNRPLVVPHVDSRFITRARKRRFYTVSENGMPQGTSFSEIDAGETVNGTFDFGPWLASGVVINSVSIACAVDFGTDNSPQNHVNGFPTITASPFTGAPAAAVIQNWGDMISGVTYVLTATAITSDGQTLQLWSRQSCSQAS